MIRAQLVIHCDSEWLVGGGESTVGTADLAPMLDAEALPFIPGRTLRGLLREAVTQIDDAFGGARDMRTGSSAPASPAKHPRLLSVMA